MPTPIDKDTPWYRNATIWLIIAFPLSAVITGFLALYYSIVSDTGLVTSHYYRKGLEINRVLDRDHAAQRHRLTAAFRLDRAGDDIRVRLTSAEPGYRLPHLVRLRLMHATRAGFDAALVLHRTGPGRYAAPLPRLVPGRWYIQMEAADWRLFGSIHYPEQTAVRIRPVDDGGAAP